MRYNCMRGTLFAGILVVVAIGVALGVFCGGLLLACVVVYWKRSAGSTLSFVLAPRLIFQLRLSLCMLQTVY